MRLLEAKASATKSKGHLRGLNFSLRRQALPYVAEALASNMERRFCSQAATSRPRAIDNPVELGSRFDSTTSSMKISASFLLATTLCFSLTSQARPEPQPQQPRRSVICAPSSGVPGAESIKAKEGEIVLSGTISSVDTNTNQITISAEKFSLPNGKSGTISPAKSKIVVLDADTFIRYTGANEARLDVAAFVVGAFVDVVGKDGGSGKPLNAREVALELPSFVTEIETLKVRTLDAGQAQPQDMTTYGQWSSDAQLFWRDGAKGNVLTLEFDAPASGNYAYELAGTKAFDYGIVRIFVNEIPNESGPIDLYNRDVVPSPVARGVAPLIAGTNVLRVEITGRNPLAYDSFVGLDSLLWKPAPSATEVGASPK